MLEKIGMTPEGTFRQHIKKWGEYLDIGNCAIIRSEYDAQARSATSRLIPVRAHAHRHRDRR